MPASNAFELQTLTWTTRHFEDGRMTIVDFKDQITSKNAAYGIKVTRIEIEYDWATNLFRLYGRDDPLRDFYYEQKYCPLFMSCYETKDTEKQDHQAFKKAPAQIGDLPSGIRMKDDKGEIFVPKIMILPFKRLQYKTFVKKVLIANGELGDRGCRRLRQLWKSLINELYFYVAEKDRKTQISKSSELDGDGYNALVAEIRQAVGPLGRSTSQRSGGNGTFVVAAPPSQTSGPGETPVGRGESSRRTELPSVPESGVTQNKRRATDDEASPADNDPPANDAPHIKKKKPLIGGSLKGIPVVDLPPRRPTPPPAFPASLPGFRF